MPSDFKRQKKGMWFPSSKKASGHALVPFVEGVHFDLFYSTPREVAYKATLTALSELSITGTKPNRVHVQCSLKQDANEHTVMELENGVKEVARRFSLATDFWVAGVSPTANFLQVLVSGNAFGKPHEVAPRVGDLIGVSGHLGAASAGLTVLRSLGRGILNSDEALGLAYLKPQGRIEEAYKLIAKKLTHGVVDIQEGLATELYTVLEDRELGAELIEKEIPLSPLATRGAQMLGMTAERWGLYGGEDFELLFFCSRSKFSAVQKLLRSFSSEAHIIGTVKPRTFGVKLKDAEGRHTTLPPRMWHPLVRRRQSR